MVVGTVVVPAEVGRVVVDATSAVQCTEFAAEEADCVAVETVVLAVIAGVVVETLVTAAAAATTTAVAPPAVR